MSTSSAFRCPVDGCSYNKPGLKRVSFIDHIEGHTKPYVCCVLNCEMQFTRIASLNKHRHTQHSIPDVYDLSVSDAIKDGSVHHKIRNYETREDLISLLLSLGTKIRPSALST
ncbi:hypothetical protein BGX38DRAFT_1235023 [Terfezia claveryi]|nr:hypothetical protein BGX38DRAFT_1235023 [Terfezia claveryi]